MAQTIACANQKGGVGKTTTVVNLATYLALAGERVLIVDLDPQGNATSGFGIDRSTLDVTLYDAILGDAELASTIVVTMVDGCSIVPASVVPRRGGGRARDRRTARAPTGSGSGTREGRLRLRLLDCPPSSGF